ncbi:hypothetical protein B0H17DRAFT_1291649, partial [Mycena rosella]
MTLELECSPGLKIALLRGLIWNLSGLPGHSHPAKQYLDLGQDTIQNAQFDDIFIRNIISRNLRHIAQLKVAWRTGVGMKKKAHKHAEPHTKPEMRTLLKLYRSTEIHSRHLTRQSMTRTPMTLPEVSRNFARAHSKRRLLNRQVIDRFFG